MNGISLDTSRTTKIFNCSDVIKETYQCQKCEYETHTKVLLQQHKCVSLLNSQRCRNCDFISYSRLTFLLHCKNCTSRSEKRINVQQAKNKSLEEVDVVKKEKCKQCDYESSCIDDLKQHNLERHRAKENNNWFKCVFCNVRFIEILDLEMHISNEHLLGFQVSLMPVSSDPSNSNAQENLNLSHNNHNNVSSRNSETPTTFACYDNEQDCIVSQNIENQIEPKIIIQEILVLNSNDNGEESSIQSDDQDVQDNPSDDCRDASFLEDIGIHNSFSSINSKTAAAVASHDNIQDRAILQNIENQIDCRSILERLALSSNETGKKRTMHSDEVSSCKESEKDAEEVTELATVCESPTIPLSANIEEIPQEPKKREPNCCIYCKRMVSNFCRHVKRNHPCELEVIKVFEHPKKSRERRRLLILLRNKGNYLKHSEGFFKPVKKVDTSSFPEKYLPCIYCLGFYLRHQLWKHTKNCPANSSKSKSSMPEAQNYLINHITIDKELKEKVFPRMMADPVALVAKKDPLICAFGVRYLKIHRPKHVINVTSSKMRELAKILMEVTQLEPAVETLFQALQPKYYDLIVKATKSVGQFDADKNIFKSPCFPASISSSLRQCCDIALEKLYTYENLSTSESESQLKSMIALLTTNWKSDLPYQTSHDLKLKKLDKIAIVPLVNETKLFKRFLSVQAVDEKNQPIKTQRRVLVAWTGEQKKVTLDFFKDHIINKKPPKRIECEILKEQYPKLLENKDWLKIKVFIQNIYTGKCKLKEDLIL